MRRTSNSQPILLAVLAVGALLMSFARADTAALDTKEKLGAALFADRNLSITRGQSCVSCHSPNLAFTDPRTLGKVDGAVSRGADRKTLGDRNAPSLLYAALTPNFSIDTDGVPRGGFFHDGRATTLEEQAGKPLLDPREMAMPDKAAIAVRIRENPDYVEAFPKLFGSAALQTDDAIFSAIEQAIAAFNRTSDFARFNSRYDRFLKGEEKLSRIETQGMSLFFAKAQCANCHMSNTEGKETFTNYRYYNLGVPANRVVRQLNGTAPGAIDVGVRTTRTDLSLRFDGAFKVPSLRNVAITAPYMHNGIYQDMRTAILFHGRLRKQEMSKVPDAAGTPQIPWADPEIPQTVDSESLTVVPALTDAEGDALEAFLATLTDREFEELLSRQ